MDFEKEYAEALEALRDENYLETLSQSEELLCHCNPISYKEVSDYVIKIDDESAELSRILSALRIAQGCGTCLNSATSLIERLLDSKKR